MSFHRITLDPAIGPPAYWIRKTTKWITSIPGFVIDAFDAIRKSRVIDRYRFVTSGAACKRDYEAHPVMLPVIRKNRKSGVGTPRVFRNNPFFPVHAEKNVMARVGAALEICKTCAMLRECRTITEELRPTGHGIVQGGAVYVEGITEFRAQIKEYNAKAPRALRIPTKGPGAWDIRRQMTKRQYDEYITNLSTSLEARAAALSVEGGILDSYEAQAEWDDAVDQHG